MGNAALHANEQNTLATDALQALLDKTVDGKKVYGVALSVTSASGESWSGSSGNMAVDDQYFIASVTKLYTTALIFILLENQQLALDDPISKFISADIMDGLHVYRSKNYSSRLTIRHLLSHTSGLPDYFEQKPEGGKNLKEKLVSNNDRGWSFGELIKFSKQIEPVFPPGKEGKAHYSDTNFQLLGKVIQSITGLEYAEALQKFIFEPLELSKTYLYADAATGTPVLFYNKSDQLNIPMAMASFGPDGGIVSTTGESMIFLKAFFSGELFSTEYLDEMQDWNKIFYPLEYGLGIMRFKLPRLFSPFKPTPELVGHSGSTG